MLPIANAAPAQNSSPLRPWKLISGDRNTVAYRPIFAKLTGSATAAILLQQILFRWDINHEEPFYKFRDTPEKEHPKYTPGDSWCEELAFSKAEFDTALIKIGTKITRGQSKRTESEYKLPNRDEWKDNEIGYGEALSIALKHLIIYWTDGGHVTWYQFNSDLMDQFLTEMYSDAKSEILIYLDKYRNRIYLDKARNRTYLSSESTRDNQRVNTFAKPANAGSQASDPTMQQFNKAVEPALTPVQENSFPTKPAEEEPPSKVAPKVSPIADWWKSEAMVAKLMLDARHSYTSRDIPEAYINPGLERICNGSLRRWWEKFAYPGGSVDFMDAVEKDACQIVQGAEYIKAHELPPATPPNAAEASPMPQSENKGLLAPVLEFPSVPKGFAWVYSSATDQPLAHLTTGSMTGPTLCKNKLNYRDFYNPGRTVVHRQPCAECLRIAAERAASPPPKDNRHGDLFKAWIDVVGKETLPAGFSYGPYMNFCKSLVKESYDVGDMTCAGFLVRRWHEANGQPIIDWKPAVVIDTIRKALALCKAGVTGPDVAIFVAAKRSESYWSGKVVPFSYVATNISTGKVAVNNGSELQESTLSGESRGDTGPEDRTNWRAEAAAKLPVIPASSRVR